MEHHIQLPNGELIIAVDDDWQGHVVAREVSFYGKPTKEWSMPAWIFSEIMGSIANEAKGHAQSLLELLRWDRQL